MSDTEAGDVAIRRVWLTKGSLHMPVKVYDGHASVPIDTIPLKNQPIYQVGARPHTPPQHMLFL